MPLYPKYTTTVIGAYSVPRWYEALDRLVTMGQLSPAIWAMPNSAPCRRRSWSRRIAGIDVITGGETHRSTHNRHSPPNAMLNHFWQKIPAFQGENRPQADHRARSRTSPIPAAICRGPIADNIDLGLVDEFNDVSEFARKPVKITMTGPHFLTAVAYDEHYNDPRAHDVRRRPSC